MDSIFNSNSWTFSPEFRKKICNIFTPQPNSRNLVSMDGDWYVMTLPFRSGWRDLYEEGAYFSDSMEVDLWGSMHLTMDLPKGPDELFFRVYFNLPNSGLVFNCTKEKISWKAKHVNTDTSLNKESTFLTTSPSVFGWRPMLIPLNQHMEIDLEILRENPNGSIMEGGAFFFRDGFYSPETKQVLDAVKWNKRDQLCLKDTQPGIPPLKWVCWNGLLYCACNLAHITCANIHERGLIFG